MSPAPGPARNNEFWFQYLGLKFRMPGTRTNLPRARKVRIRVSEPFHDPELPRGVPRGREKTSRTDVKRGREQFGLPHPRLGSSFLALPSVARFCSRRRNFPGQQSIFRGQTNLDPSRFRRPEIAPSRSFPLGKSGLPQPKMNCLSRRKNAGRSRSGKGDRGCRKSACGGMACRSPRNRPQLRQGCSGQLNPPSAGRREVPAGQNPSQQRKYRGDSLGGSNHLRIGPSHPILIKRTGKPRRIEPGFFFFFWTSTLTGSSTRRCQIVCSDPCPDLQGLRLVFF